MVINLYLQLILHLETDGRNEYRQVLSLQGPVYGFEFMHTCYNKFTCNTHVFILIWYWEQNAGYGYIHDVINSHGIHVYLYSVCTAHGNRLQGVDTSML